MTMNDAKFAALRAQGYTGALSDMLLAWLRSNTGLTTGSMNDLWYALCLANGVPAGALPDMKAALWPVLGYDNEYAFWLAGGAGGSFDPSSLFTGGETGDYWDFTTTTGLYQDTAKTTPVTTAGDVIGAAVGVRGVLDITQATTANKLIWRLSPTGRAGGLLGQSTTRKSLSGNFGSGFGGDVTLVFGGCNDASSDGGSILITQYANNSNRIHANIAVATNYANAGCLIGGSHYSVSNSDGTGTTAGPDYVIVVTHDSATQTLQMDVKIGTADQQTFTTSTGPGAAFGNNFAIGINIANTPLVARTVASRVLTVNRKATPTEIANLISWAGGSA